MCLTAAATLLDCVQSVNHELLAAGKNQEQLQLLPLLKKQPGLQSWRIPLYQASDRVTVTVTGSKVAEDLR